MRIFSLFFASVVSLAVANPGHSNSFERRGPSHSGWQSPGRLRKALFPLGTGEQWWSTSLASFWPRPLSDSTLRPTKEIKALKHPYVVGPAGKYAMQISYPNGSTAFSRRPQGGVSFYGLGPEDMDLTTAREATFGYSIYFPEDFAFVKGGKIPGLYGGDSEEKSVSCSGGSRSDECFSIRMMWRTNGMGEFYTYVPPDAPENTILCDIPPFSECNPTYGSSVGRGAFTFPTGKWVTVTERVRLNDVGVANGEIELFFDGESVINVHGVVLRMRDEGRMRGIMMQSFFGGSDDSWATPRDQDVFFSDFTMVITERFEDLESELPPIPDVSVSISIGIGISLPSGVPLPSIESPSPSEVEPTSSSSVPTAAVEA